MQTAFQPQSNFEVKQRQSQKGPIFEHHSPEGATRFSSPPNANPFKSSKTNDHRHHDFLGAKTTQSAFHKHDHDHMRPSETHSQRGGDGSMKFSHHEHYSEKSKGMKDLFQQEELIHKAHLYEEENRSLTKKLAKEEAEKKNLKSLLIEKLDKIKELEVEINEKDESLKEMGEVKAGLENQKMETKKAYNEKEKLNETIIQNKAKYAEIERKYTENEIALREAEKNIGVKAVVIEELSDKFDNLERKHDECECIISDLKDELQVQSKKQQAYLESHLIRDKNEKTIQSLQLEKSALLSEIEKLKKNIENINKESIVDRKTIKDLKIENETYRNDLKRQKNDMVQLNDVHTNEINRMQNKYNNLMEINLNLETENKKFQHKIVEFNLKIEEIKKEYQQTLKNLQNHYEASLKEARKKMDFECATNKELSENVEHKKNEIVRKADHYEAQISRLQLEVNRLNDQLKDYDNIMNKNKELKIELDSTHLKILSLTSELENLREKYQLEDIEHSKLKSLYQHNSEDLINYKTYYDAYKKLIIDNDNLRGQLESTKQIVESNKEDLKDVHKLNLDIMELKEIIDILEREKHDLEVQINNLNMKFQEDLSQEKKNFRKAIEELERIKSETKGSKLETVNTMSVLNIENKDLLDQNKMLKQQCEKFHEVKFENSKLKHQISSLTLEIESLKKAIYSHKSLFSSNVEGLTSSTVIKQQEQHEVKTHNLDFPKRVEEHKEIGGGGYSVGNYSISTGNYTISKELEGNHDSMSELQKQLDELKNKLEISKRGEESYHHQYQHVIEDNKAHHHHNQHQYQHVIEDHTHHHHQHQPVVIEDNKVLHHQHQYQHGYEDHKGHHHQHVIEDNNKAHQHQYQHVSEDNKGHHQHHLYQHEIEGNKPLHHQHQYQYVIEDNKAHIHSSPLKMTEFDVRIQDSIKVSPKITLPRKTT